MEYAQGKLAEFAAKSEWYDPDTFCDPVFSVGNGLLMSPGTRNSCAIALLLTNH